MMLLFSGLLSVPGFTPVAWLGFVLLGFGLLIHITLVNVVLGMSVIVPITEYIGYRRKDKDLENLARRLFRYLALSDLIAGVFGTWIAVMLAAFWPKLLYIFSTILLAPIILALVGIFMAIPAIAIYWYGWNRVSKKAHLAIGGVMAIGGLLVPAGFRVLFAFINNPSLFDVTLNANSVSGSPNLFLLFKNPLYVTLLFHSWFGGLTMSSLFAAGAFGWIISGKFRKSNPQSKLDGQFAYQRSVLGLIPSTWEKGGELPNQVSKNQNVGEGQNEKVLGVAVGETNGWDAVRELKFVRYLLKIGLASLSVQSATGVIYFFVLQRFSPYIYAAITGNTSIAAYSFSPLFAVFLSFVALIWVSTIALYLKAGRRNFRTPSRWASFLLMLSSVAALPLGEALNDASRTPYMIVSGSIGIAANNLANSTIPITWPVAVIAVLVGIFTVAVLLSTLYLVFVRRK